jgi:NADH:ubiquinone oxidoreductase subunit 5 (subunit L)/multisubunit Na+/H+ antiporter MnhA subunit
VRSLVHRSTLVTAGLFLIFGFRYICILKRLNQILLGFGLVTMVLSRILGIYEKDVKKVVALRTMSQIGFCVFTLSLRFSFLTYLHLLSHAFFKSCLFIQVGFIIYWFFSQQDVRGYMLYD